MPDLSQQTGNPTSFIHNNYQDLMALAERDPEAAAIQVIQAAESMVGTGLSMMNFKKLKMRAMKAAQRGAFGIQKFLSDYLLAGTDPSLKVSSVSRFEAIEALGTLICEDIDRPPIEWTRDLLFIKEVAESHGLTIIREESITSWHHGRDPSEYGWVFNNETSLDGASIGSCESRKDAEAIGVPPAVLDAFEEYEKAGGGGLSPSYGVRLDEWLQSGW